MVQILVISLGKSFVLRMAIGTIRQGLLLLYKPRLLVHWRYQGNHIAMFFFKDLESVVLQVTPLVPLLRDKCNITRWGGIENKESEK